jgi:hypothetical protein
MYYEIVGTNARLAGSLHQWPADSGTGDLPHWVWDAYRWSEKIYLEADLSEAKSFVRLTDGRSLQNVLPASIWTALMEALPRGADLSPLKPWAALMALQFVGTPMVEGVEPQVYARAKADSKSLRYLETMAEFSGRLDNVRAADYVEAFGVALEKLPDLRQVLREMRSAWISRRVEEVEAVLPRTLLGLPRVARLMLDDRNLAWLPRIEATIQAPERTLIMIGAAHLPRATGLLTLLGHRGYELRLVHQSANA